MKLFHSGRAFQCTAQARSPAVHEETAACSSLCRRTLESAQVTSWLWLCLSLWDVVLNSSCMRRKLLFPLLAVLEYMYLYTHTVNRHVSTVLHVCYPASQHGSHELGRSRVARLSWAVWHRLLHTIGKRTCIAAAKKSFAPKARLAMQEFDTCDRLILFIDLSIHVILLFKNGWWNVNGVFYRMQWSLHSQSYETGIHTCTCIQTLFGACVL